MACKYSITEENLRRFRGKLPRWNGRQMSVGKPKNMNRKTKKSRRKSWGTRNLTFKMEAEKNGQNETVAVEIEAEADAEKWSGRNGFVCEGEGGVEEGEGQVGVEKSKKEEGTSNDVNTYWGMTTARQTWEEMSEEEEDISGCSIPWMNWVELDCRAVKVKTMERSCVDWEIWQVAK